MEQNGQRVERVAELSARARGTLRERDAHPRPAVGDAAASRSLRAWASAVSHASRPISRPGARLRTDVS